MKGERGGRVQGVQTGREREGRVTGMGGVTAEEGGREGCQTEGSGGSRQAENDGARGVAKEGKRGTGGKSGRFYFISTFVLLTLL